MKQGQLKLALLCICCFFPILAAFSQVKVYAESVSSFASDPNPPNDSYVDNVAQAVDENLSTAATVRANSGIAGGAGAYSGYIELEFASTLTANTTSYVKIDMEDDILSYLLGGSLGELLSDIAGGVLSGNQRISVEVKNDDTTIFTKDSWVVSDFSSSELRVVIDDSGDYFLKITPQSSYNRIRITNSLGSLVGVDTQKDLNVYDAFYITGSADCGVANYTSYNSTGLTVGLLNLGGTAVTNPEFLIDANITNYSELDIGILGVAASVSQTVYFEGASAVDDEYQIKFLVPPALLEVGVLNNIQIIAYNGTSQVASYSLVSLLSVDVLGLLSTNTPVSVSITPGIVDRITVRLSTLVDVSVGQNLNLFSVVKGDFDVDVTGEGSYAIDDDATLTAEATGCNGPYTYSWSGDGTATGDEISPSTAVAGTYNFLVTATDKFGATKTVPAQIVVEPMPVAGTITGAQDVCEGTLPPDLVLTGFTGNVLSWERSTDPTFTTFTTIAVTSSTLDSATIGVINETTYFRANVGNHTYSDVVTDAVALSIKETTWNGATWSNGVPDINTTIYFTGDYNEEANLFGCTANIDNNAEVVIPSGYNITLNGAVTVVSGNFLVENNANLVQITNAVNSGAIQVQKNTSLIYRLDYTIWSSPVAGQNLKDFSPSTLSNRFYEYNETTDLYNAISPEITDFTVGHGYLIRVANNHPAYVDDETPGVAWTGTFEGVPNNGTVTVPVASVFNGYNLVGNPYSSAINIHDFFDGNVSVIDPGSSLYFWRKRNDYSVSSYATITKAAYTANAAAGGDTGSETFVGAPSSWVINTGQGFFVQASSGGTLVFENSMRRAVNNGQFFRQAEEQQEIYRLSRLWLNITGSQNEFKQAAIAYTGQGTIGIDYGWDGKALIDDGPVALYSIAEDMELAIQTRPEFEVEDMVVIGYKVTTPGSYTISLDHFDGVFLYGQDIYLKDNVTNQTINLKEADYTFTTETGQFTNRFEIIYTIQALDGNNFTITPNDVVVYQKEGTITIDAGNLDIDQVTIHDLRGRLIYTKPSINATVTTITDCNVQQQVVLLHITTAKGVVTKKVVL
ncbi:hypothetical protein DVK85_00475 [Flavobacterium arcticum]|uniref:T9SS C-terminal target domain-containing protein n=1 Tax=Flavobacterium arcticum TaxID=1784713 RepID=A0A345H876_9FLAO|nr:T9SS sorting signal type C domain-containing protein [Flavobacterium arcticum]AXG72786.1 hypothetical protein DVK85_00475 [Flavobacterium arcticum]KAF2510944.1 T9SS sorting signal type C domain-containing protein [Flavobacterium arcticum]